MEKRKEESHNCHHFRREGMDGCSESIQSALVVITSGTLNEIPVLVSREKRNAQLPEVCLEGAGHTCHIQLALARISQRVSP